MSLYIHHNIPQGLNKALGRLPRQLPPSFSISVAMSFVSAWKGQVVNWCEVLTYKCVEVWESLRLIHTQMRGYCKFQKWVLRLDSGWGIWGDACGVGYFWSMGVVCCHLRLSRNHNVVLLDKIKDAPAVLDSDRMLGENGIYYRVWEVDLCRTFSKISHWNQLNVCCERD